MRFTIVGPPRTKKTSQRIVRNRRTGRMLVVSSKLSKSWETDAAAQLEAALVRMGDAAVRRGAVCDLPALPLRQPANCRALFYREANRGDLVNFMQALADALQAAGVVENDRLIVSWDGSRLLVDRENPRVEIELTPAVGLLP